MSLLADAMVPKARGEFASEISTIVLWVAGLAMVAAVCVYLVGKFRGGFRESDVDASHLMTNFRDLHSQGELSDEEYRNIKSKLATQLQEWAEKTEAENEVEKS